MRLNSFPQNNQGLPNILEVQGDAPEWLRDAVSRMQFKKAVTHWLDILVRQFEDNVNVKLFEPVLLSTELENIYAQASFRTNIGAATLVNLTAAAVVVKIYITTSEPNPAGAAWYGSVAPNSTMSAAELVGQAVESDEKIVAVASAADAVSLRMSGLKDRLR